MTRQLQRPQRNCAEPASGYYLELHARGKGKAGAGRKLSNGARNASGNFDAKGAATLYRLAHESLNNFPFYHYLRENGIEGMAIKR